MTGDFGGAAFLVDGTGTATACEAVGVGFGGTEGVPVDVGVAVGCAGVDAGPPLGTAVLGTAVLGTAVLGTASCEQPADPSTSTAVSRPSTGPTARLPAIPAIPAPRMIM
ncbi:MULTISPECIES: hypothetical protein [unclassified Streptomyces]|uniref:hypothetical protein n=1 Tax=unclassified Streptomyces TaxID=2593676 RepID=UPI0036E9B3CB